MHCTKLLEDLRNLIIKKLLSEQNVLKFYLDALEHKEERVMSSCLSLIINNFSEIHKDLQDDCFDFLNKVNYENFLEIISSDDLSVTHEKMLIEMTRSYIKARDSIKLEKVIVKAEDAHPPELWALLTEDEKKARENKFAEDKAKEEEVENAKLKKDAEEYAKKTETERI